MRLIDADKLLVHLNDCALSASPGSGSLKDPGRGASEEILRGSGIYQRAH